MSEPELTPTLPLDTGDGSGLLVRDAIALLSAGELTVEGQVIDASNATFYCAVDDGVRQAACVYKPVAGERPLWDFPGRELGRREVAAYELSSLAGFHLVPYTAWVDGPYGEGSLQVWVDDDDTDVVLDLVPTGDVRDDDTTGLIRYDDRDWHRVLDGLDGADRDVTLLHADDPRLRTMALFDAVINNADRKGGHILASQGRLFGVDHGISFHPEPKLRTLLWGWAGQPFTDQEIARLRIVADVVGEFEGLLGAEDTEALGTRVARLLARGVFPSPRGTRHVIPWPPW